MPNKPFRIIGYLPDWDGAVDATQLALVTHVNYAFVIPNADGSISEPGNEEKLTTLVPMAHARGVKVLISVGGWGHEKAFSAMASFAITRDRFVQNISAYADKFALDGIDMDWEYPQLVDSQNYTTLMQNLRAQTKQRKQLLTIAVVSHGSNAEGTSAEVLGMCDFVNVMVYDGTPESEHSTMALAVQSMQYWHDRGLPQGKMILGVPFYSRPSELPFKKIVESQPGARDMDSVELNGVTNYYNGLSTMRAKTQLAQKLGSGIMIWHLGLDAEGEASLLRVISKTALQ